MKPIKPKYLHIVKLRDKHNQTFEEIGDSLGVSRQRAWQLYQRALGRMSTSAWKKLVGDQAGKKLLAA